MENHHEDPTPKEETKTELDAGEKEAQEDRQKILEPVVPISSGPQDSPGLATFLTTGLLMLSLICAFTLARSGKTLPQEEGQKASSVLGMLQGGGGKDGIAVIKVYGAIQTGQEGSFLSEDSGGDAIVKKLRTLSKNEHVKAVVVRLNTPGGTVGASQEVYAELKRFRDKGIPVIASMADVCASGGVYIAAAADRIFANAGTLTGSIGVIMQAPNIEELMKKMGVDSSVIKSGQFKDIGSMTREMSPQEQALLQEIVDSTYDQFVGAVAEGRGLSTTAVAEFADGRIFNGEQAKALGLVDEIGTFQDALEAAREQAGLDEIILIEPDENPLRQFRFMLNSMFNPLSELKAYLGFQSPLQYRMEGSGL